MSIPLNRAPLGLALFMALIAAAPAMAQSRSIYGAGVDEAAALVRLVNAGASSPPALRIGAIKLSATAPGDSTSYQPSAVDIYVLSYAGKRYEFMPEAGSYYSLIAVGSSLVIVNDTKHTDPARAQIYFYNMTAGTPAELKTADGSTRVVGPCASGSSAQIAVNPVTASLAVFKDGSKIGGDLLIRLERGSSMSIFSYPSQTGTAVFAVKASIATE